MSQKRVSAPLALLVELAQSKGLAFNDKLFKMTKLAVDGSGSMSRAARLCPLFQPISNKNNELIQFRDSPSASKGSGESAELNALRLEFIVLLSDFYLSPSVGAHKFAFHCMEFALQFFGGVGEGVFQDGHVLADIYARLGECCEALGQSALAMSHYKSAIAYDSAHYEALCGVAELLVGCAELAEAHAILKQALKVNAFDERAWRIAAQIQQRRGKFEMASNSYLTALELQRDEPIEPYSKVPRWRAL